MDRRIGVELISQHEETFRTNNCAEAFHGSQRKVFNAAHPNFFDFVEKLSDVMDRAENEFNVERVNPKRVNQKAIETNAKVKQLVDAFKAKDVLALELPELLDRISTLIGGSFTFEERFEDGSECAAGFVDAVSAMTARSRWSRKPA